MSLIERYLVEVSKISEILINLSISFCAENKQPVMELLRLALLFFFTDYSLLRSIINKPHGIGQENLENLGNHVVKNKSFVFPLSSTPLGCILRKITDV